MNENIPALLALFFFAGVWVGWTLREVKVLKGTIHKMVITKKENGVSVGCSCGWVSAQTATDPNMAVSIYNAHVKNNL